MRIILTRFVSFVFVCIALALSSCSQSNRQNLAIQLHEKCDVSQIPSSAKDIGVDIIAWKPFHDNRGNQVIFLLQCASGYHWRKKQQMAERWDFIISRLVPFTKGIITSDIVEENEWIEQSRTFYLIFDRARLYRLWQKATIDNAVRNSVLEWCNTVIPQQIGE